MLGRRTSLIALIYEPDVAPHAFASSYSRGAVGASGYMIGYVFRGNNTFTSSTVIWEKSADSGETFTTVAAGGDNAITYTDIVVYGASSSRYRGKTVLTISNLENSDYGLYRVKAIDDSSGETLTHYSKNFDFSNPA
jgi:hypothetical protein